MRRWFSPAPLEYSALHAPALARLNRLTWAISLLMALSAGLWLLALRPPCECDGYSGLILGTPLLAGLLLVYRKRGELRIFLGLQNTAQLLIATGAGVVLTYLGASLALPLVDEPLIALDRALGFDWLSHIAWLNAHPEVSLALRWAYLSIGPQCITIVIALFLARQTAMLQHYAFAYALTLAFTVVIASLWPAVAGYMHYGLDAAAHPGLQAAAPLAHAEHVLGLRAGTLSPLRIEYKGILTFPSFHASVAVMLAYAGLALRALWLPCLALNALMLVSVLGHGGHYLADALAGATLALASIALAQRIHPIPLFTAKRLARGAGLT